VEQIFETVLFSAYIDITNTKIIIPMLALTSGLMVYRNTPTNKYKYVCMLSLTVAISLTVWTYMFFPVPSEARTLLVGSFVFLFNFLVAVFWGSATYFVYRYSYMRKLARQMTDAGDGV
jgi:hypothetical protein